MPAGHGGGVRGDSTVSRSDVFSGRYGRIFSSLPAATWPRSALLQLGLAMTAAPDRDTVNPSLPAAPPEDPWTRLQDSQENAGIPAGYTYFTQFIDHDITFDPASSLMQQNDPDALVDFRTPFLDLDSLYGRGPDDQPYMYSSDGKKFRLGTALYYKDQPSKFSDLPRFADPNDPNGPKRAIIGDKRNDENVITAQLHAVMQHFHNRLVDLPGNATASFQDIQQQVRWHYQWIVVNDVLPRICGEDVVGSILPHLGKDLPIWENPPRLAFFKWRNDPFMPVEFSVAAYRFGHTMVRPIYRLNQQLAGGDNPAAATADEMRRGLQGRFFVFAGVQFRGLNGFDQFPKQWGIDWSLYFDIDGSISKTGAARVQPAFKIQPSLVNPLGFLPEFSQPPAAAQPPLTVSELQSVPVDPVNDPANLAQRNLLRGMTMGLPSGQAVARAMGLKPIDDENLRVGKSVISDLKSNPTLVSFDPSFAGNAPLWCYILAETQHEWAQRAQGPGGNGDAEPVRLGSVGARIVAETLIGLLWGDGQSYLRQAPNWVSPLAIRTMGDLIKFAAN